MLIASVTPSNGRVVEHAELSSSLGAARAGRLVDVRLPRDYNYTCECVGRVRAGCAGGASSRHCRHDRLRTRDAAEQRYYTTTI